MSNLSMNGRCEDSYEKINFLDYPICLSHPLLIDNVSAWVEHIPFGMFIVDLLRPKIIVELGTHTGVSYSAFCQTVLQLGIKTHCYAIDTWAGDPHSGIYGEKILNDLKIFHDKYYNSFSELIQTTFDSAASLFKDNSIDLLHIDGFHTYDAVKHDFETWLPKISQSGVILFHDISERGKDFGVWKLWQELKINYPSFEFSHGHGLGILAVGRNYPPSLNKLLYSERIPDIQNFFYQLGEKMENEYIAKDFLSQVNEQEIIKKLNENKITIELLESELAQKDKDIEEMNSENVMYATSKSWRYTRILRKIMITFRGSKNG